MNCFRKAGISSESQEAAIAEDDDPFKELQDEIDYLLSIEPDHFAENIDAASLTGVDAGLAAIQRSPTDAEIVAELLVNEEEDGSDEEEEDGSDEEEEDGSDEEEEDGSDEEEEDGSDEEEEDGSDEEEEDGSDDESAVEEEDEPLQCPNENERLQVIETK